MPPEGTYAYSHVLSRDKLFLGDAAVDTEPFRQPFFATITHGPAGCFTLAAFISRGPKGRHDHAWRFCNACERDAASLDLVEENDRFEVTSLGVKQLTSYACVRPNPYLVTDLPADASVTQGACTGSGSGSQTNTIQTLPRGYKYHGVEARKYESEDASMMTHKFERLGEVIVTGGGSPTTDQSLYWFDVDSGLMTGNLLVTRTTATFGGLPVTYQFSLVMNRVTSDVTPLIPEP